MPALVAGIQVMDGLKSEDVKGWRVITAPANHAGMTEPIAFNASRKTNGRIPKRGVGAASNEARVRFEKDKRGLFAPDD